MTEKSISQVVTTKWQRLFEFQNANRLVDATSYDSNKRASDIDSCSNRRAGYSAMSLKFGIYLVEQRIISPEQFCGIIKIREESVATLATIALRKNLMTIKQVQIVLGLIDIESNASFVQLALDKGMIDQQDASTLLTSQEETMPTVESLLVECGLLTKHQCSVLFAHFQKQATSGLVNAHSHSKSVKGPHTAGTASQAGNSTLADTPKSRPAAAPASGQAPRQPKFQQHRPMIVPHQAGKN